MERTNIMADLMKDYIDEAESVLLHTYNRYQVVFDHGDGVHLYDMNGKKYLDFVSGNLNRAFSINIPYTGLKLPIGISFFTFQALSYVVDVYRKKADPENNPFYVGL